MAKQVDDAPIGDLRHSEPWHGPEGAFVVEGLGENSTRIPKEALVRLVRHLRRS